MIEITHHHAKRPAVRQQFQGIKDIGQFYRKMKRITGYEPGSVYEIFCEFFLKRFEEVLPMYITDVEPARSCNPGYDFTFFNSRDERGIIECKWKNDLTYRFAAPELASFTNELNYLKLPRSRCILFTNVKNNKPFTTTVSQHFDDWFVVIDGNLQQQLVSNDRHFWRFLNESLGNYKPNNKK